MSRNYKFHNPEGLYFISFAVVGWLDVFIRNEYKEILLESLRFCQKNKGMKLYTKYSSQNFLIILKNILQNLSTKTKHDIICRSKLIYLFL